MESSYLAHLPGRGVQTFSLAWDASLYRPGAARGRERGGGGGGGMGVSPALLPPQRHLQGPKSAALVHASRAPVAAPVEGRTQAGAQGGAGGRRAPGKGAAGRSVRGQCLTPALGQSPRLRVPKERG